MKISLNWLKDYVSVGISAEKLSYKLTMAGLEVEKVDKVSGDTVFELEITPNRPDCLNMIGIAREVSAILNKTLKLPKAVKGGIPRKKCSIRVLDKEGCSRYIGTVIKDVHPASSPLWLKKKLKTIGIRSINNIVDITNFCLMETGQPLHAFDYDKLKEKRIVVRRAHQGEEITTLDGIKRTLDPSILMIADAKRAVAIAGIMGGQDTEVTEKTKNILLESAYFDPVLIRRAARKLGLSSDSSYRFERGVDVQMVQGAAARATSLILKSAGGTVQEYNDVFHLKGKAAREKITLSIDHINSLLGASLTLSRCKTMLQKLGFKVTVKSKNKLTVSPPSFRADLKQDVDIIEEVARILGYDNLPSSFPRIKISKIPEDSNRQLKDTLRKFLLSQGLNEAITYALINPESLEKTGLQSLKGVRVKNPLTQEQEILRPHLLPSLLSVLRSNFNRGQKNVRLFEIGKVYLRAGEEDVFAVIMTGMRLKDWRILQKEGIDFYDIKGVVSKTLERMGLLNIHYTVKDNGLFVPGQGASLAFAKEGKEIGVMGKLKKTLLKEWNIKQDNIFFAQIEMEPLFKHRKLHCRYRPVSGFPVVTRDVSLAVKKGITFAQVKEIAYQLGAGFLVNIDFVEQYLGEKIPDDHQGLIFTLVYQSSSRTLTEEEVNRIHGRICQALVQDLQAIIR